MASLPLRAHQVGLSGLKTPAAGDQKTKPFPPWAAKLLAKTSWGWKGSSMGDGWGVGDSAPAGFFGFWKKSVGMSDAWVLGAENFRGPGSG
jgi:hypothetical protein